jgi:hypothetical protein
METSLGVPFEAKVTWRLGSAPFAYARRRLGSVEPT